MIQVRVDLDPGVEFGKHWHPGEEVVYVIEGSLEYRVEGQDAVVLEAGDVLFIPARMIHSAKNVGATNGAELATYLVEKGKPLVVRRRHRRPARRSPRIRFSIPTQRPPSVDRKWPGRKG
jgi:mannose-6-phosphate isomerase-like protein (cupin superfamily)